MKKTNITLNCLRIENLEIEKLKLKRNWNCNEIEIEIEKMLNLSFKKLFPKKLNKIVQFWTKKEGLCTKIMNHRQRKMNSETA